MHECLVYYTYIHHDYNLSFCLKIICSIKTSNYQTYSLDTNTKNNLNKNCLEHQVFVIYNVNIKHSPI